MNVEAYLPNDLSDLISLAGTLALVVITAFAVTRVPALPVARALAWALTVVSVVFVTFTSGSDPAGYRMIAIILALLFSMKSVCGVEVAHSAGTRLNLIQWTAYSVLWFGMRPEAFASFPGPARSGIAPLLRKAAIAIATGGVLIAAATLLWSRGHDVLADSPRLVVATALLLPGLSLLLHFGLFNLLAGAWRSLGADTYPLFREPLASLSLDVFWSRRWNRGFSEMTSLAVYRPLTARFSDRMARILAFAFSGLLHELAISVPPNAGYGLPSAYFLLHVSLLQIEARPAVKRFLRANKFRARAWVISSLLLPVPILFHIPFLSQCVWPVAGIER